MLLLLFNSLLVDLGTVTPQKPQTALAWRTVMYTFIHIFIICDCRDLGGLGLMTVNSFCLTVAFLEIYEVFMSSLKRAFCRFMDDKAKWSIENRVWGGGVINVDWKDCFWQRVFQSAVCLFPPNPVISATFRGTVWQGQEDVKGRDINE